ncbi:hypothetical protein G7067_06990 [Leucobacter insecticola]|uniref:Uncharacterized protein n=1 Tax=Leucobacter insecticola TaxID=2714934 RepID=A0A6G8FIB2_9MICO|nr:hypothetical protein [Leucobacter insecticola]QIM16226.1 hypothetical protein G7067_06990 [Leucobacter insecticola]
MSGSEMVEGERSPQPLQREQQDLADELASVRREREQSENYLLQMSDGMRQLEEAAAGGDPKDYFVQKRLAGFRDLESGLRRITMQRLEFLDEEEREMRARLEENEQRLRTERQEKS